MILADARVVFLFVGTLLAFFVLPRSWRRGVLVSSGLFFAWWSARTFIPLVILLIVFTWSSSGRIGVWLNALTLVGVMLWFKLHGGGQALTGMLTAEQIAQRATLPLGLSFLVFELIHVAVERHRTRLKNVSLLSLAAFALYFPCRTAGPIKRYPAFDASIDSARWTITQTYQGLVRILWGCLKKVVLADVFVLIAQEMNFPVTTLQAWKGMLAYSLYLFVDFSAYSDIAIGMSWCLGLSVPENFRWPYLSRHIRDFWSRWHMSLSSWLLDYVFLPISKRLALAPYRVPAKRAVVIGYLITFAICGVWHGPTSHFLLWGLYHGVLLSGYALWASSRARGRRRRVHFLLERLVTVGAWGVTSVLVLIGWVLFAFETPKAIEVLRRMAGWGG